MKVGRRIYFDIENGNLLVDTGEAMGDIPQATVEKDIRDYKILSERNRETFDVIQLEYGQYAQDFMECNGYRVNPDTKELEFSYPNPDEEEPQEPVYQKPLSEEILDLKKQLLDVQDYIVNKQYEELLQEGGL